MLLAAKQHYAGVNVRGSNGTSSYNSLNLKFQTQNLHNTGLSMVSNFTWAHSLFNDFQFDLAPKVLQGGSEVRRQPRVFGFP